MSLVIDNHVQWLPEDFFTNAALRQAYLACVPRAYDYAAREVTSPGGDLAMVAVEWPRGYGNLSITRLHADPEERVATMAEAGIDRAILRVPVWQEWLDLEMCRRTNDAMAAYIKRHPNTFYGLGVVPPLGAKEALAEAERCIKDLGFVGMELSSHYGVLYLDEPEYRPFFHKIEELGVPVNVHHSPLPVDYHQLLKNTNLRRAYGRLVEQGTSVLRELFSDLFEECPTLKLIHAELGGAFFAIVDKVFPKSSRVWEETERFDLSEYEKLQRYLRHNLYFDMFTPGAFGKAQLECAVRTLGAPNLLFGSAYPIRRDWMLNAVEDIRSLAISEDEKRSILGGNANELYKLQLQ